ncbi:murein biosynthesis integral membrane protein MurJ [Sphingopyxis sp. DHUNG17]|uniref:murein biosynthesis integral membrane protein MurJ n=1 Tax=Sphingopyxis TaxID=165697 RepID=UPI00191F67D0|nr:MULTISPECIES: murein biosynthesis integral membrane protein MurJ [Sphingopyxis]MBL0769302.1 murein biosynthesis integral membrane protein MurJ [Sphingopyxis lutea]
MSSLIKSVGTIGGLTMVSRLFGFVRDMLLSRILGAGGVADAWQLAFQLPNIFRRLFAEGAFAAAFVPLFNQRMTKEGDASEARRFAESVLAVLIPILIVFSALLLVVMPWVMGLFASDRLEGDPPMFGHAVLMARIAFPYLAFMSVATLFAAILNSLSRFAAAAAAPIMLNICLIAALLLGMVQGDGSEAARTATGLYLAIAVTLSGLFQLGWLFFWVRRAGFAPALRRPRMTAGVREMGVLILPAVFGAGIYQISRFIDLFFIATLPDKSITYLAMADRLNQLPLGIIGIALGTAILPALSRFIAASDDDGAARLQSNAVELAMLLTVPAAVALFVAGPAITSAFYVGGNYSVADGLATGAVVGGLVVGLPAYVLVKVLVPNFFARKDTRTPVWTAGASLLLNIALNLLLIPRFGIVGLALAGSIAAWSNVAMLYTILHRSGRYRLSPRVAGRIVRIVVAAAAMAIALHYLIPLAGDAFVGGVFERIAALSALVAAGATIFFGCAFLLGVVNRETVGQLRRRQL